MANEITIQCGIQAAKGGAVVNSTGSGAAVSVSRDMTGADMVQGTIATSTTAASFSPTGISGEYDLLIRNMADPATASAQFVRVGSATGSPITAIRTLVRPGQTRIITVESGGAVHIQSDSGTPTLFYAAVEL